ncbi:uncharacterized protein MONBRDRAFT_33636 [Monosiga brevicollis MX1]|uniref:F-actin-capping protein subunit beta n=1 Tax=Monosiga brevicollis TaxID=81824 RepID=A9V6Q7_MONBE|nr:uncharacterized protein MONBRDRAFT_33636 [Monosiga brevicollis MX1]EDQ86776.1 predicted protein [Monosiga brevicollis MX1]|eukprot:XP_001748321.1 hypothetical protein [Monosiga brevicollis MX1]
MSDQQLDCALDLMRRLPPQKIEENLTGLIDLVPSLCEDLLSSIDQPLKRATDPESGRHYLLCDYNRDGDSYRSPWSNQYYPAMDDGVVPSPELRELEIQANNAFDSYRDLYYEGGASSVYLWDTEEDGFAGVVLIKKIGDGSKKIKGCWDSIHVFQVLEKSNGRNATYQLTSTVMLWLETNKDGSGLMQLGGSLTRQAEQDCTVDDNNPHIANIGRMIEDMENQMRSVLNQIYFGKTKDIVNDLRSVKSLKEAQSHMQMQKDIAAALTLRNKKN